MRLPPSIRASGLALSAGLLLVAGAARGQVPLVDYEPSARAAQIRDNAAWRLAFRPPLQVLQQTVGQLRAAPGLDPAVLRQVDDLVQQASKQPPADVQRTLWRAVAALTGQAWTPEQEMLSALALRTPTPIWSGKGDTLRLEALFPPAATVPGAYQLDLFASEPTTSATPRKGALVRTVAKGALGPAFPARVPVALDGLPDGSYLLVGKASAGAARTEFAQSVFLLHNLPARHKALSAALARIPGHQEAKWLAEYPFALAEAITAGKREIISYDFPAALQRSERIVADLKAGRDGVRQAKGLQNRAYRFEPTGELIPYQVYVPSAWTPDRTWPLMVALHGANLDETNMLGRDNGRMQKLAEQHGFIVVTPLGYRLNSAYGSERGMGAIAGNDVERRRRSEEDVLRVVALADAEYNVDPRRRYLTGNSMGGGGTWWIGGRHPELWAAIAPAAYGGVLPEDTASLARVPILAIVGDHDELGMLDRVRASVATLRAGGANPEYVEVAGGTHASAFETTLPEVFKFFEKHAK